MATKYSWTLEKVVDGSIDSSAESLKLKPFAEMIDQIDSCSDTPDGLCLGIHVLRGKGKGVDGFWGYAERHADGRLYLPFHAESMRGDKLLIPARFHVELYLAQIAIYGRPEKNDKQRRST